MKRLLYIALTFCSLAVVAQPAAPTLRDNTIGEVIDAMTPEEKVFMVIGNKNNEWRKYIGVGSTWCCERLGIPPAILDDGPAGLRMKPIRDNDSTRTFYCTAFPTATALAASWDTELVEKVGCAMGNEVLEYGSDVLLAPALNIHRNPLCGRNFEYYSEDPLLTGKIGAAMVRGIQSQGVGTSVKHFAANNQESNRKGVNAVISQRALREIYLRGFEIVVKEAEPWTIMSSYNKINGFYASQNRDLLTTVLRREWGFRGVVMTDWVCGDDGVAQLKAGNDLVMPGFPVTYSHYHYAEIQNSLKDKTLDESVLDASIRRILEFVRKTPRYRGYAYSSAPDLEGHARIARDAAEETMVLLKNEDAALPLRKSRRVALFGKTSYDFIAGGTGSGEVYYHHAVSLKEGLRKAGFRVSAGADRFYTEFVDSVFRTASGRAKYAVTNHPEPEIDAALIASEVRNTDLAVITIGRLSGEGADRPEKGYFTFSDSEDRLIREVCATYHAAGKKVVVILNIGGVIETASWKELPDAILLAWQTGQSGGAAVADILCGRVNPSGRLPMSYPVVYADVPSSGSFPGLPKEKPVNTFYNEGIYVGYRYYTTFGVPVSYPFGYGLSYTRFEYGGLRLGGSSFNGGMEVSVEVTNTGETPGREVVQLYLSAPVQELDKPVRELKGFAKTRLLAPGESQRVTFTLDERSLASFRSGTGCWVADAGNYEVQIGASSEDIRQKALFTLGHELVVERLHDVLQPNLPVKDLGSASAEALEDKKPFDRFHGLDYEFNWHW